MYAHRRRHSGVLAKKHTLDRHAGAAVGVVASVLAVLILGVAGYAYRRWAPLFGGGDRLRVGLPIPLGRLPLQIGPWTGQDVNIPTTTREYMEDNFADDFISRRYFGPGGATQTDVYVVYCSARPSGILGHQPLMCYPAHGWVLEEDGTRLSEVTTAGGREIPCRIHRFYMPGPTYARAVVLNFYVVNGKCVTSERVFSGLWGRTPNLNGDYARYVAQVQISAPVENTVRSAARDMIELILAYLPDESGIVRAAGPTADPNGLTGSGPPVP